VDLLAVLPAEAVAAAVDAVAVAVRIPHRVGIGWRAEIAAFIFDNSELITDVELIVENFWDLSKKQLDTIRLLGQMHKTHFHSVSLGIAGCRPLPKDLLRKFHYFFDRCPIETWSDHFSFVRSHDIELGHLAAPPRNAHTAEIILNNLAFIKKEFGQMPVLENVSTLLMPPMSTMSEAQWINGILKMSESGLLLDINNVYCNALNFDQDPFNALDDYPFQHVRQIHMSGGKWIQSANKKHMLDDHKQDIPEIGFQMLRRALARIEKPIAIILERDGNYPSTQVLRQQLLRIHEIIQSTPAPQKEIVHELSRF
jgi:uncharacterized protein